MTATPTEGAATFRRILLAGAALALAIAIVGGAIAVLLGGWSAALSVLVGAVLAFVFAGATAASILLAGRLSRGDMLSPAYFGVIGAVFLVKLIVYFIALEVLARQPWIAPVPLVIAMIVSVMGSLAIDVTAVSRSRAFRSIGVTLPGDETPGNERS